MRSRPILLAAILLLAPVLLRAQPNRWEADILRFEEADRQRLPPAGGALFVGSSSILGWETLEADFPSTPVIRRGFGGAHLADVVYYAGRIVTPYRPGRIVVYAGDNDLADGRTPEQVAADFRALVEYVHFRLPAARIAFIAIKPSIARWHLADRIRQANELVRRYTEQDRRLAYIDVFTPMLGADGRPRPELFVRDGLHLSPEGYALWKQQVEPFL